MFTITKHQMYQRSVAVVDTARASILHICISLFQKPASMPGSVTCTTAKKTVDGSEFGDFSNHEYSAPYWQLHQVLFFKIFLIPVAGIFSELDAAIVELLYGYCILLNSTPQNKRIVLACWHRRLSCRFSFSDKLP